MVMVSLATGGGVIAYVREIRQDLTEFRITTTGKQATAEERWVHIRESLDRIESSLP